MKKEEKMLVFAVISFFVVKLFLLVPAYSDENIYFNMAKNMVEKGLIPYRDFFYAHPPLHIYLLFFTFSIFGESVFIGKLVPLVFSSLCAVLVFFISKEFFKKDKKIPLIASLIFLFSPQMLSFSSLAYGMWPAIFWGLLSLYFILDKKPILSAFFCTLAIFTRYLLFFYLPILFYFSYKNNTHRKFIFSFLFIFSVFFVTSSLLFNHSFVKDTILYHLFSKIIYGIRPVIIEYLAMNSPFIFLSLFFLYFNKKYRLYAIMPLLLDVVILLMFKLSFYHYFLISLPFYSIMAGHLITKTEYMEAFFVIFLFMIFANMGSIFFNNTASSDLFVAKTFFNNLTKPRLFGDPIVTNYLAFVSDAKIIGNYFDGDINRLRFENYIFEDIFSNKPDYFIASDYYPITYFENLKRYYKKIFQFGSFANFTVYQIAS